MAARAPRWWNSSRVTRLAVRQRGGCMRSAGSCGWMSAGCMWMGRSTEPRTAKPQQGRREGGNAQTSPHKMPSRTKGRVIGCREGMPVAVPSRLLGVSRFGACSVWFRKLGNHLDLELVAVQPRNTDAGERGVRRFAPVRRGDLPNPFEVLFRIHHENGGVDHVVEAASSGGEDCIEVLKGSPDLCLKVGLHRTVFAA